MMTPLEVERDRMMVALITLIYERLDCIIRSPVGDLQQEVITKEIRREWVRMSEPRPTTAMHRYTASEGG